MRTLLIILALISSSFAAHADELEKAYQKEYAYLVAEKKALEQRLASIKANNKNALNSVSKEIEQLQQTYLDKKNREDRLNQLILEASRDADFTENDSLLLDTTLLQAKGSLNKVGVDIDETQDSDQQLAASYQEADQIIARDGTVYTTQGDFFQLNGESVSGTIINVGRIAKYGLSAESSGVLAPAGDGKFKIWEAGTAKTAKMLNNDKHPEQIATFFYDNAEKAMEQQEEKGFMDDLEAGGLIGKVILVIGIIGAILVMVRLIFLLLFSADVQKMTTTVNAKLREGGLDEALAVCKNKMSSASRVIAATLRNIDKDRDHIEDIVGESVLHESSRLDRFGSIIIVIAAVSPLLGLLGTVTGMISTFDIITEFGTGDPKLLSTGISEALVTTKFGLIVAIPMLLLGNMLSGWATRTKNDLERAALNIINNHKAAASA